MRPMLICVLCVITAIPSVAAALEPAFTLDDIDLEHCRVVVGGEETGKPTPEALAAAFRGGAEPATWSTDERAELERHFVVTLKRPVVLGTVCAPDYPGTAAVPFRKPQGLFVSILRSDAPDATDATDDSQWQLLRPGAIKYLPVGTTTRALRFSEIYTRPFGRTGTHASVLGRVVCLSDRYYPATDVGSVVRRRTDNNNELVIGSWVDPLPISGVFLHGPTATDCTVTWLTEGSTHPPVRAPDEEWTPITTSEQQSTNVISLDPPTVTRAVRVAARFDGRESGLTNLIPLVSLGDRELSPGASEPAPFRVPYTMPMPGFVAIDVHDRDTGRLVRRLVGETPREEGPVAESWDLRDEYGHIVPPGEYTWRGIARPPFKLTYELTLYNAGQPAWRAPSPPANGGGMWLADHAPPQCAATQGDIMWLGTGCTEDGHCLIATDLAGNKLWGTGHIAEGFRGPSRIATDDRCVYGITNTIIYRVDPQRDFAGRSIFTIESTAKRPWNVGPTESNPAIGGLAARDGKLYCAINLPNRWLKSSFVADTMDPTNSEPSVRLYKNGGRRRENEKVDKVYGFGRYDELQSFYAAFFTERMPSETLSYPGVAIECNGEAYFGDAPTDGRNRGRLVAVFKEPVTVGSILIPDGSIKVQVLKPGIALSKAVTSAGSGADSTTVAAGGTGGDEDLDALLNDFQDDAGDDDPQSNIWITLASTGGPGMPTVAVAPGGGLKTRAIRYKAKKLAFSQVMGHRLTDITPDAERVFAEGVLTPQGGVWVTRNGRAITALQPAVMALRWTVSHDVRGLGFMRIGTGEFRPKLPTRLGIDRWIGGTGDVRDGLDDDSQWEEVSEFALPSDVTFFQADFGGAITTTALRVRCLDGNAVREPKGMYVSGFHGIVAYEPAGDDPSDLPTNMNQRIAVLQLPPPEDDTSQAEPVCDIPLRQPNALAFDATGTLHCVSDGQIVTVPLTGEQKPRVVVGRDHIERPVHFTFGPKGLIYVTDNGPKVVKVLDAKTGTLVRTVGTAGGSKPGTWDPARLINPAQIAVDKSGRIWVAERTYTPKRVVVFNTDGTVYRSFLGPTQYGGGGSMDPRDRSIVMYNGMKFRIDWSDRTWKLEALLGHNVERPVYCRGRRYIVGPFPGPSELTMVTVERDNQVIPVAVAGQLGAWSALTKHAELRAGLGHFDPERTSVIWSDANGDGIPQPQETQCMTNRPPKDNWDVGEDLSFYAVPVYGRDGICVRPAGFTEAGVPLYDAATTVTVTPHAMPRQTRRAWGDEKGRFFFIGTRLIDADGQTVLWEYPSPYTQHAGFYNTPFRHQRPAGVLSQEHFPIAHFRVGEEEFFVTNSDPGDWYCYTADGMLVGCLFGGPRGYGLQRWPAEWERGKTELVDLRLAQEHYQGCVVKADDGNVYAVAGHNHMSVVRIDGLDKLQRMSGAVTVTADDLEKTRQWRTRQDVLDRARTEPKVATMLRAGVPPAITGTLEEWPNEIFETVALDVMPGLNETITYLDGKAAVAYDSANLYLAMFVRDESPMKNSVEDLKTLFKGGDAAELTIGLDVGADPHRRDAAMGDLRLLFSVVKNKPVAVLYKPVDGQAPKSVHATFVSPVGKLHMDRVEVIRDARVAVKTKRYQQLKDGITMDGSYWTLEAAVPWDAMGVSPPSPGTTVRGDFGYLRSDQHGAVTVTREYWSGKSQSVVSDTPSEARLCPALWGEFVVTRPDRALRFLDPVGATTMSGLLDEAVDDTDILEELGE